VPGVTPSQTVGPFFHLALPFAGGTRLVRPNTAGTPVVIEVTVLDGAGAPVPDALIEVWQANAFGRHAHPDDRQDRVLDPTFDGFGRAATNELGRFTIETIKPGPVPGPGGESQAPHLLLGVFARGILTRLVTRLYFGDEPSTETDPILRLVPPERRGTLIATLAGENRYRFEIVLQGDSETVFFDV
jgi:protocatechuate 3,4-dioxygenase alpha subunit